MIREDLFYCLSCSLEMPAERSARIFRTGFYRSEMRLGLCGRCHGRSDAAERAGGKGIPENTHPADASGSNGLPRNRRNRPGPGGRLG